MRWQGISSVLFLLLAAAASDAGAQNRYDLALRFAYVHSFDTNPLLMPGPSTGWGNGNDLFAEAELTATSEHRQFDLRYMYGRQANPAIVNQNSNIHQFNFSLAQDFTPTVHFSLTDFTTYTNDYTPNEVYSGEAGIDPGNQNPADIYLGRAEQLQNLANAELRWEASPRSEVRVMYANRLFHYGSSSAGVEYSDSMQNVLEAGYRYRFTSHVSAGLLYRYQYIDFTNYDNTQSHAVLGSFGWQIRPTVSLDGAAGPITTNNTQTGDSEVFLNARASLVKTFPHDVFSVNYARDLANTDGVFGASMADVVYLTWGRMLFQKLDWSFHGGYSRQKVLDSPTSTQNWFVATGLRYQINQYIEAYSVYRWTQQTIEEAGSAVTLRHQVLLGVRFTLPHVWRKEG